MICYVEGFVVRVAVLTALVWCEVLQFLAFPENSAFPFAVLVYPKMVSENPKAGSPATSENHGLRAGKAHIVMRRTFGSFSLREFFKRGT